MMRHELEILRAGADDADTLLLIHGTNPISPKAEFVAELARNRQIIAPSHPGFGASPLPPDFDTMYDLVNLYLDVLDNLPVTKLRSSASVSAAGSPPNSLSAGTQSCTA